MRSGTIAFLIGICCLNFWPHLPSLIAVIGLLSLPLLLICFLCRGHKQIFLNIAIGILGFIWALLNASLILNEALPTALESKPVIAVGIISSVPESTSLGMRFIFSITHFCVDKKIINHKISVRLLWITPAPKLAVGQNWRLGVKLKRPHGFANPGSFDYEEWLFQNRIRATGYVVKNPSNQLLQIIKHRYWLDSVRQRLSETISQQLAGNPFLGLVMALTLGDKSQITPAQWQVFSATGTNHLMVIAGLHIAICSGFLYALVSFCWRRINNLALYLPAPLAATLTALGGACIYSALAGFSVPTQRALIMLIVFMLAILLRRNIPPWHALMCAMLVILVIDPLATLSIGFWLSFTAVAVIGYGVSHRIHIHSLWGRIGRVQWVIALGLLPLTLFYFQQASFISFFANCFAIPWFGFLVEPLCIVGALLLLCHIALGNLFLHFAVYLLGLFWPILQWFAGLHRFMWHAAIPSIWVLFCSIIGMLLCLAPKGLPGRWLLVFWLLPLYWQKPLQPPTGSVWFTVLDVGQGLATIVQTAHHTIIYDAGPRFSSDLDAGTAVVYPFLSTFNMNRINKMIISHGDNDHIGGAFSLLQSLSINAIETSVPERFASNVAAQYCEQGKQWQWDGVSFIYLYPPKDRRGLDNNSSCVLLIKIANYKILLTGDIEKFAEDYLVNHEKTELHADILVAPHHGSASSLSIPFMTAVKPRYVIFSTGYKNQYHFPKPAIIDAYQELGALTLNTADTGAIIFKINSNFPLQPPVLFRKKYHHFWGF
jgi:competence protein ComEC